MVLIIAALAGVFIFVPEFADAYTLPKTLWFTGVATAMAAHLLCRRTEPKFPHAALIGGIVALDALSAMNAVNTASFQVQFGMDLAGVAVFYYVINYIDDGDAFDKELKTESVVAVMLLFGMVAAVGGFFARDPKFLMGNVGYNSLFVMLGTVLAIHAASQQRTLPGTASLLFVPLFLIGLLYTANNKAALLGVAVAVTFLLWLSRKKWVIIAATSGVVLLVGALAYQRVVNTNRVELWRNTVEIIKDHPILGVGRGNFKHIYPKYANAAVRDSAFDIVEHATPPIVKRTQAHAHNDYLEIAAEVGLIAVLLIAVLIVKVFAASNFAMSRRTRTLGACVVASLVYGMFWFPTELPTAQAWIWTLLALLCESTNEKSL